MALDFIETAEKTIKKNTYIYPKFMVSGRHKDLMVRGGDFYAVWDEDKGLWSTDEDDLIFMVDEIVKAKADEKECGWLRMRDGDTGLIDKWHKYCSKQMRDCYKPLDERIIFANDEVKKEDYASKRLPYPIEKGSTKSWDKLMGVLYSPEELHKLEWAIGAIVTGDAKTLEKFFVLYGSGGTGKGTYLKIVQMLFGDYCAVFNAKNLGDPNNQFALEPFSNNPLVAIDPDGKLDRIEDNTRLNTIVSHEKMTVNEKFKKQYSTNFKAMLLIGSNSPVRITDAKSGLIRRLVDVSPTGNTLKRRDYNRLWKNIPFELGAIAYKCREVYLDDPEFFDDYRPINMMGTTNTFYDYILENSFVFEEQDYTTLKQAWELYKKYAEDALVPYKMTRLKFKEELKNYFEKFEERALMGGKQVRNLYSHFVIDKFHVIPDKNTEDPKDYILVLDQTESLLDEMLKDCPAQYANEMGVPKFKWENVKRKLSNIDTHKIHYVKVPENHIVIDFDIPDPETGEKSYELNLQAASKFPPTYAEVSKSGKAIHLHYIYNGDVDKLETLYAEHIEIKVFKGNMALRRKLSACNNHPVTTISSGLPLKKGDDKVIDFEGIKNEKALRTMIKKCINREYHDNTKPSMDFLKKILDDAYESGMKYNVSDMRTAVLQFAASSSHQPHYCIGLLKEIHWASDDAIEELERYEPKIIFLDIEIWPNLFLVCWEPLESDHCEIMFNPSATEIEAIIRDYDFVGHNVRKYDNHMLYAAALGYSTEKLANLNRRIIVLKDKNAFFSSAYGLSYADTLDYPREKKSLKRWEIDLKLPHKEFEFGFDKDLPEKYWKIAADYCVNDVKATKKVFLATKSDFKVRCMLAKIAGGIPNDTTNSLSTKFIFGGNRNPQSDFLYRNMGDESKIETRITGIVDAKGRVWSVDPEYTCMDGNGRPIFPGYKFEHGKSWYRDEDPKEGGYVYSEPGYHGHVALLDIASMHPSSIIAEMLFGEYFTKRFADIVKARLAIKHKDFDTARKMFGGALAPYLDDEESAEDLANALKIVINSVYGLTSARFDNPFKDKRNIDNIVAKRGALFMINLKHEVQAKGFKVAHIKTDSIKIPDATPEIIDFVNAYGKLYGYTFEHEATYERMCLADRANYIAYYALTEWCADKYGYIPDKNEKAWNPLDKEGNPLPPKPWTATGDKYARPFIFKPLFSGEELTFDDMCEVKQVKTSIYLDFNEELPDVSAEEKEVKKLETKYRKGELGDTTFVKECERLLPIIEKGHNYIFVGRVGEFVPIKEGCHGGLCMRQNENGKYGAVEGTKGYRWMESYFVTENKLEDDIDMGYFKAQMDKVVEESQILPGGDFEWFRNVEDPYVGPQFTVEGIPIYPDEVPFDED